MKEFGRRSEKTLKKLKLFFGSKYTDKDAEKYAAALSNTEFPEAEDCDRTAEEFDELCQQAEDLLNAEYPAGKEQRFHGGIVLRRLGKPRVQRPQELKEQLNVLCERMCRTLAGYEEPLELSIVQDDELGTQFRLSDERSDPEALKSMLRGVYSQVEADACPRVDAEYRECLYASLTVPYRDSRQEEPQKEKTESNWVDAVLQALPAQGEYRITMRFFPIESDDRILLKEQSELQAAADRLKFSSEIDWNHSDSLGISHKRSNNLGERFKDIPKDVIVGAEDVSGNYGASYGWSRHQRSKRAEHLISRIDQKLYRLGRAMQSLAWRTELIVEANDETVVQSICACLRGALQRSRYTLSWRESRCTAAILSSEELIPLMRFPTQEYGGFEFIENEEFSLVSPANPDQGMQIGDLLWNGFKASRFALPYNALNRHAFICGMTGAGKTNTLFKILEAAKVPFLVIEPVKGEYRSLASKYKDLHVWTMKASNQNAPNLSILRINPFWFPENSSIAFHVDSIKTIIASAFEMSNAMPNILEQCMYNIYIKAGWNIITNKNRYVGKIPDKFLYPTFSDLLDEIEDYLDHSKFVGETLGDYHGAMTTRLKSFVNGYKGLLLNTEEYPDYEQMMNGRAVIELEGLADDADKCLVMGTILVQYFEYLKLHFKGDVKGLRHLMVIEEAHRLFKNVEKRQGGGEQRGADPTGQLVDTLSNIMAEIRAFGEGLMIVDQSPSKIAEDVIKNSSTKIIHRIDNDKDIKMLQAALLLRDDHTSIPALAQGEALVRTEGMRRPCKIKAYLSEIKDDYQLSASFQNGDVSRKELENAFAATAILSDDEISKEIHTAIWLVLITLEQRGFDEWKTYVDEMLCSIINTLMDRRRYDLVDGSIDVMRQLISQTIRGIRSSTANGISVYELGAMHLFFQSLIELYGESCRDIPEKEGNIHLIERFFERNIAPVAYERLKEIEKAAEAEEDAENEPEG